MILPRAFDPARHKIGLFSPSSHIDGFPRRTRRAITNLAARCQGVVMAPGALDRSGGNAGDPGARARQIAWLIEHDEVGLLMATTGGYGCVSLLDAVDFASIAAAAKPILGSSDGTALLLAITAATGLVTFHGPMALPDFGGADAADFTWSELTRVLSGAAGPLALPSRGDDAFRLWELDDADPVELAPLPAPVVLEAGEGEGPLFGGNLDTVMVVAGSGHAPLAPGRLLFLEAAFGTWEKLERDLLALEARGLFYGAAGLVFGRPFQVAGASDAAVRDLVGSIAARHRLPCVYGLPLGHSLPVMTLPLGTPMRLETDPIRLTLLEGATA
jgi:muramoyltetrapeptide carboxypeptidase